MVELWPTVPTRWVGVRSRFFDDHATSPRSGIWPVIGGTSVLRQHLNDFAGVFVAVGDNAIRSALLRDLEEHAAPIPTIIHCNANVSGRIDVDEGCVVVGGACINIGAVISRGVIVNSAATVDHDCILGDCVHVSPGAHLAGNVRVGERSWVLSG